jgi:hypothetical protein
MGVQGTEIAIYSIDQKDYMSLTDIARYRNSEANADVVKNWLRSGSLSPGLRKELSRCWGGLGSE